MDRGNVTTLCDTPVVGLVDMIDRDRGRIRRNISHEWSSRCRRRAQRGEKHSCEHHVGRKCGPRELLWPIETMQSAQQVNVCVSHLSEHSRKIEIGILRQVYQACQSMNGGGRCEWAGCGAHLPSCSHPLHCSSVGALLVWL